ncbi:MAG: hypothetical protein JSR71_04705 [Proteobacteria bacterium]|nr:hypothetical protein [Pseudomonadota bacterium]
MQSDRSIFERVRAVLGDEILLSAIVYVSHETVRAGTKIQFGDALMDVPWDAWIVFADLEPQANWGHRCVYLILQCEGNEFVQESAQMPPFLKPGGMPFRLLWKGSEVPDWAVASL